ncbi:MAG: hypothetical protein DCC55_16900 [Chloroflexi bacterium]|nr:MAG: hypothetical protein DCC55_16900 [Chloroflexota bacterium]
MSTANGRVPHLIILANEPRMLREMLQRALDGTPGFIVVDQNAELHQLADLLQQVQLDWLVVTLGADGEIEREALAWLKRTPSLSLLALTADGSMGEIFLKTSEQEVLKFTLIEISLTALLTILSYKWDDPHLPHVLCTLRVLQGGHHRYQEPRAQRMVGWRQTVKPPLAK